ncbi:MAG TPA: phosphotransferase [Propionibacteriaceae bacterium]|nr:phosphotransferase [Propionibacteriaceae bacterium]
MNDFWNHISRARWFSGKGRDGQLAEVTPLDWLAEPRPGLPGVRSEVATVRYPDGSVEFYQLLVSYRPEPLGPESVIGPAPDEPALGVAHDATRDPEAMRLAVSALLSNADTRTWQAVVNETVEGDLTPKLFTGEQSNSNVMLGDVALLKVFRKLEPGHNLDIQVHDALGRAGVHAVARLLGWMSASVPGLGDGEGVVDLMMLVEKLPDAEDGWELALEYARANRDFSGHSALLGTALRAIHDALVDTFPTRQVSGSELAEAMVRRLDVAALAAPALADHREGLVRLFRRLDGQRLRAQRIHGDFHLGQTLHLRGDSSPDAWRIIDFEGEPMKQMWERVLPDSPWRDVAGMMRSLSYATSAHADPLGAEAQGWLTASREAFLSAYAGTLSDQDAAVLAAYEADKSVYEVVYETRNRPDWLPIPLSGITQLIQRTAT